MAVCVTRVSGTFSPAPFRDLYFGRVLDQASRKPVGGSPGASARFGRSGRAGWAPEVTGSQTLSAMKAAADSNHGRASRPCRRRTKA